MNEQNLRPFNSMTADEHRELSRRGGLASAAARRAKRARIESIKAEKRAASEFRHEELAELKAMCRGLAYFARGRR